MTTLFKRVSCLLIVILLMTSAVFSFSACNKISPNSSKEIIDVPSFKNLILIIGDGMGYGHIEAGELFSCEKYPFTEFKCTDVNTDSWNSITGSADKLTDSAAAATALATGHITKNRYIGKDYNGEDLDTIMDIAIELGKSTGIVTTDKITGATPSGFTAHSLDRDNSAEIFQSQLGSGVNLLCSSITSESVSAMNDIISAGYSYCDDYNNRNDILSSDYAYCQFNLSGGSNKIKLSSATSFALDFLSKDEDGFVLVIEMAHIDKNAHNNDFAQVVDCVESLNDTVNEVIKWIGKRTDTALIVTADHETGGLHVPFDEYKYLNTFASESGNNISYKFSTKNHTKTYVGCFTYGFDVDYSKFEVFKSKTLIKNSEIFSMMKSLIS